MQKVLIANRGEIAVRIIRTLRKMGIRTVAVFSDVDRDAIHVHMADEVVALGDPTASNSYLNIDKIIRAARDTGADAIHPGYGFLSENAAFAAAVKEAGLIFIGPPPSAIEMMGSKLMAKQAAEEVGIPLVPGTATPIEDENEALKFAREIGFPVLIKASAGGGGKGMRIVEKDNQFQESLARARSEAMNAFGDASVFIEKYINSPRHIEIQILRDTHGNCIYLGERECSIQRRHQKVIEEAPSVVVSPGMRQSMGEDAVRIAEACAYEGAGTVEFIVDEDLNYYFLEMNTRLQVEHPVTEAVTGIDLVEQQVLIARGEPMPVRQEEIVIRGHAIELRVYAEDPLDGFMPSIGTLHHYREPAGQGVRVDSGYSEGMDIPLQYDPMISKLITYGNTRAEAISRMLEAINNYVVDGVATTLPFGRFVLLSEPFVTGQFDTHFVGNYFAGKTELVSQDIANVAALFAAHLQSQYAGSLHVDALRKTTQWGVQNLGD